MPQDLTIHDYASFETKVLAEGIPRPTLHWIKDSKQVKADEPGYAFKFGEVGEKQVNSEFSIAHFSAKDAGDVSLLICLLLFNYIQL